MNECQESQGLLERYIDRELDAAVMECVERHLAGCAGCAKRVELLEREAGLLREALAVAADEVPEDLAEGVWEMLRQPALRRARHIWYGVAVAAGVMIALFVGLMLGGRSGEGVQLARVITCTGPVEVRMQGRDWEALAAYSILSAGDRLRCGEDMPGGLILSANRRIDLDSGAELVLRAGDDERLTFDLARGRVHVEVSNLKQTLSIGTPVARVTVQESPRAELEIAVAGPEPPVESLRVERVGFLDSIHVLPSAYGAELLQPELEVIVYEGLVQLVNDSGERAEVGPGERIVVSGRGPMPQPAAFDVSARLPWWPLPEARVARLYEAAPAAAAESRLVPESDVARESEEIFEPAAPKPPQAPRLEGPPAPAELTARPDIHSVLLAWTPVRGPRRPVVEYKIYRRAPGDTEFAPVGHFPVLERTIDRYVFQDDASIGAEYEYAVAAAWRGDDGGLVEGPMSCVVTAAPADFLIHYLGNDRDNVASIAVDKFYEGSFRRQTFHVRERNLAAAETGEIGEPREIGLSAAEGSRRVLIDFTTGYHLASITASAESVGRPRKTYIITIENDLGIKREIDQESD